MNCPFCHLDLDEGIEVHMCPGCRAVYHAECWAMVKRCFVCTGEDSSAVALAAAMEPEEQQAGDATVTEAGFSPPMPEDASAAELAALDAVRPAEPHPGLRQAPTPPHWDSRAYTIRLAVALTVLAVLLIAFKLVQVRPSEERRQAETSPAPGPPPRPSAALADAMQRQEDLIAWVAEASEPETDLLPPQSQRQVRAASPSIATDSGPSAAIWSKVLDVRRAAARHSELEEKAANFSTVLAAKRQEFEQCRQQRWVEFFYQDPLTQSTYKLSIDGTVKGMAYFSGSNYYGYDSPGTMAFQDHKTMWEWLEQQLSALEKRAQTLDLSVTMSRVALQRHLAELRALLPARYNVPDDELQKMVLSGRLSQYQPARDPDRVEPAPMPAGWKRQGERRLP